MKRTIGLLKIGEINQSILFKLRKNLKKSFIGVNFSIRIIQEAIPLDIVDYNPNRKQYNASKLLTKIIYNFQNSQIFRILGVIDEDIYTKTLNFVFGLAINPKIRDTEIPIAALISVARLRESFYRRAENNVVFKQRLLKEAIHELGHTLGLKHCNNFCIMRFSNTLIDTNNKPSKFCESCQKKLNVFCKNF
ncbi:MAG: archaemetzincin family Zn-dependent metalloprotease [Candidatus Odinarchaeota archaeon]